MPFAGDAMVELEQICADQLGVPAPPMNVMAFSSSSSSVNSR
jgi:hypothetical protein